jgi:hypothetical protein
VTHSLNAEGSICAFQAEEMHSTKGISGDDGTAIVRHGACKLWVQVEKDRESNLS